ncbi:MAG: pyrroline-5-carboxylate reductase [Porticoccaceae bacterium]
MSKIVFIGGGNMASCLIGGMLANGIAREQVLVSEPGTDARQKLSQLHGIETTADNRAAAAQATLLVLAVKPQIMAAVTKELATALAHKPAVVSIAAGIPLAALENWLGTEIALVRAMPNTPALVKSGATGLFANALLSEQQKQLVDQLFESVGYACWVEREALIDAVIAVSGSGPAYFFLVLEAMQKIGQELGLSKQTAEALSLHTAMGASRMALESDATAAELRQQVTSPGGTTQSAINSFEQQGLENTFRQAMTSAVDRAEQMSKDFTL